MTSALRSLGRFALRQWPRTGRAHGYWYQAMERWGAALGEPTPLVSRLPNGAEMACDVRDHVQRQIYFGGAYEPVEAFLFVRLLRPGDVVIDAGANVGQYTLLASSAVGPGGAVHSFEPVPRTFDRLRGHVERNGYANVRANRLALWREPATLRLGLPTDEVNDGTFSIGAANAAVEAQAVRLDDYLREHGEPEVHFIKMDIEGAELGALEGAAGTLARCRPLVLMEFNREACARLGYDPQAFWDVFAPLGYTAWRVGLSPADWLALRCAAGVDRANVLFTPGLLPAAAAGGWDFRQCVRWAASGGRGKWA